MEGEKEGHKTKYFLGNGKFLFELNHSLIELESTISKRKELWV